MQMVRQHNDGVDVERTSLSCLSSGIP